ncbi:hypothetical protein [Myxococcus landrumensis]|uniref:Lipoprotein n=1 Tax=Myxococcus landrumensis TaxID=2813577 RepID=A0ABX7N1K4_9BACT|nr:hypothetical protein [Myxococcus landrumus]QSQ12483.1 hypothetical protein JY572_29560 [Myxococcus landrumus]
MRRLVVLVASLGLSACGGGVESPEAEPQGVSETEQAVCTGNAWECFCGGYKTQTACNQASSSNGWHCYWQSATLAAGRCLPTYE